MSVPKTTLTNGSRFNIRTGMGPKARQVIADQAISRLLILTRTVV
ncbi:MAG: hypothetical protein OEZ32_07845 [Nitrospinota bacterium]|nr:hypothetical protein [Nitrospinota bacterium]